MADNKPQQSTSSTSVIKSPPCSDNMGNCLKLVKVIKSIQSQISDLTSQMASLSSQLKQPLKKQDQNSASKTAVPVRSLVKLNARQSTISRKKVLILADSHGRGCGSILSQYLNNNYDISSLVKPGAGIDEIVKMVNKQTAEFGENDWLIIMGGSNDVVHDGSHSVKFIKALNELLPLSKKMNIIINTLPVSSWDVERINMVTNTNKSMHCVINRATHKNSANICINFLDNIINNKHFTKSGTHLNDLGKRVVCKKLSLFITQKCNVVTTYVKPTLLECWLKTKKCKPISTSGNIPQNTSSKRKSTFLDRWLSTYVSPKPKVFQLPQSSAEVAKDSPPSFLEVVKRGLTGS